MLDIDKKGELEFLIDTLLDEAQNMCSRCEKLGEPDYQCKDGVMWHRVVVRTPGKSDRMGLRECNASAINRIIWLVRDRYNG